MTISRTSLPSGGSTLDVARWAREVLRHDSLFWRKFAYEGTVRSPEWWRRYSPPVFGALFYAALPRIRRTVESNQARLLGVPEGSFAAKRAALELFRQYAHCFTDTLEMSGRPDRPFEHEVVDQHFFHEARARGKGVIFVTAHTGSWEVGGRFLALDHSVRVTMVMAEERNPGVRGYVDELRARAGIEVVYASGSDPATALTLLSRLRANQVVAIQLDRGAPSGNVIETRLCGVRWPVPAGAFRLAQATGATVIPLFLHRSGYRRYTLALDEPIQVPTSREPASLSVAAQKATDALERFVRAHPDQWFHFAPMPQG